MHGKYNLVAKVKRHHKYAMLIFEKDYEKLTTNFKWQIPTHYNIGVDICDKHDPSKLAIIYRAQDGVVTNYSFGDLKAQSNRLSNLFKRLGGEKGDRVAILLPQAPECAVGHIATYKSGMIAVPLFVLFGVEALEYRLNACGAKILITDRTGLTKIMAMRDQLPALEHIICIDGDCEGILGFHEEVAKESTDFTPLNTLAEDPAIIIFTSGTTGNPKGALHAHRVLLGHLPGVEFPHEFFPQENDLFWTPADWAWIGGLIDVLLPSLHHGRPVLAYRAAKFDAQEAFQLMADFKVRNAFIPPTALKLMRQIKNPKARHDFNLRSLGTGGETMGQELLNWGRETFGLTINEFYGQTECNLVVGNCAGIMDTKPGSMGRAIPGHRVGVINDAGEEVPCGQQGAIAVMQPDPVMFLNYWHNEKATAEKFIGDWLLTGDTGYQDADGYFFYVGRDDDVITTAGYRVGPGEIEDCLIKHEAIQMAGVIGVPDPIRTQAVKAFVVLKAGYAPSDKLAKEIQNHVKVQLAAHEYPRIVTFIDELPMTTTGKVMRRKLRDIDD